MKYLRYKGEFLGVTGVTWRAEIWQEAEAAFPKSADLEFDADQPLMIEWGEKSKEEVICGSSATLKVISPGDRTFTDLYSIEVGRVRLDVYRAGSLYWSGCIDTEFYEEPYERLNNYTVSLTFSDFGVWDRLNFDLSGMKTLRELVQYGIDRCGMNCGGIDDSMISTVAFERKGIIMGGGLLALKVSGDNFYDEDGEPSSLEDVIEGVLQPLALRIIQRAGKVYVYDINGLYGAENARAVEWDGDSQTLGVDSVYNNAKITWSTYARSGNLLTGKAWPENIETPADTVSLNNPGGGMADNGTQYFSYHSSPDVSDWNDATGCGFTLWIHPNFYAPHSFRIVPQYSGAEAEGFCLHFTSIAAEKKGDDLEVSVSHPYSYLEDLPGKMNDLGDVIYKSAPVSLPNVDDASGLLLRVSLEMLLDPRVNPFEEARNIGPIKCKTWYDNWNKYGDFVYVPVTIKYKPYDSDTLFVWNNTLIATEPVSKPFRSFADTLGKWDLITNKEKPERWGWLAYYDAEDAEHKCGVLGWKKNRPAINPHRKETEAALRKADAGQYIPYPKNGTAGGELTVEIRAGGWHIVDDNHDLNDNNDNPKELWKKISMLLFKMPEVEIVNARQFDSAISTEDVEYSARLNAAAKEAIEIDTVCGTSAAGVPTARGAYFTKSGRQLTELRRAGRTGQAEDLLIGTLYSQFAERRTKISGEARLLGGGLTAYTEANQGGRLFIAAGDVQDCRMECSDAVFVEIRPDEYKRDNE